MPNKEIDKVLLNNVSILKDLVGYQQGNVVSRTIIDKPTGTVTLFAFTKEQGLSEHTAPYDALVHVLDGEAEIIIDGKFYNVKEGEAIIMPANHPHRLTAKNEFKMILTMIKT
ncbi:cupin domain-containing protein [Petrotoga sp. 9PWA.NaAc.5.4]|uniref:cupin domain-containing protein n=1 Tax=Petrotoga sp. 9PWA.NaAc.5.4 TaxID=1434328 RepID=UPI000CAEA3DE|nr:cupin domain-containing protein [Petrotoga sp. 9PWA.NaAc.5.4]PNR96614.1 cupin [Petrotoga sp. 9PWA.NaAc.5.4]